MDFLACRNILAINMEEWPIRLSKKTPKVYFCKHCAYSIQSRMFIIWGIGVNTTNFRLDLYLYLVYVFVGDVYNVEMRGGNAAIGDWANIRWP